MPNSKFQIPNSSHGFSLLELIIYLALFSGFVLGLVYFTLSINNSRSKTYVAQEVHANARIALDIISQRIRSSTGIDAGPPPSVFGSHPGRITLDFSGIDSTKDPTVIDLDANGVLQIKEGLANAVALTSDKVRVTSLIFTNVTATSTRENIRINMTLEYNNTSGDPTFSYIKAFTTAVSVRQ